MWFSKRRPEAIARVAGGAGTPCLYGTVQFHRVRGGVLVTADICGLPATQTNIFGLHIHEGTSCTGEGFADTKGHYNPEKAAHPAHAGDLPPLFSCRGRGYLSVLTDRFCLKNVIGKTLVIHECPDDFHTQPAGNAGKKIACGVICEP